MAQENCGGRGDFSRKCNVKNTEVEGNIRVSVSSELQAGGASSSAAHWDRSESTISCRACEMGEMGTHQAGD